MPVILSEVEESLDNCQPAKDASASLDMTTRLCAALEVYHDSTSHSAAMNMAIDEALLEHAAIPAIRLYRWHSPALSFGYFGKFADVAQHAAERDLVRRWTGGGNVFHGKDLTYSIVIPANDRAFNESSIAIYERVHLALCEALAANGQAAKLSIVAALYERRNSRKGDLQIAPAVADRRSFGCDCFANPVRADVTIGNRKVAGAAQRRTRRGLLHQGSIQNVHLDIALAERFAQALSTNCNEQKITQGMLNRARRLAQHKYGTDFWLRKR